MTNKKLESFKIGDTQRPTVGKQAAAAGAVRQGEDQSLGFARIERILENDDATAVGESLNSLLRALEEFETQAKTNKDKAAAKKAMIAVERGADLLDYLFQTKLSMQTGSAD